MKEYDILDSNTKKVQLFNENTILANMDWYLPQLYSFFSDMGFTVIINNTLLQDEMTERIDNYYVPYHKEIERLLKEKLKYFEKVYLIDLHSLGRNVGCDIVLGNNCGKTTSNDFFEIMKNSLEKCGFIVSSNKPYKGGYITKNYREKFNNCETLQIELYYGTYIDNRAFIEEYKPTVNENVFYNTQRKMMRVFEKMKEII